MLKEQHTQMEKQFELKLQKLILDQQQIQTKRPILEIESKVDKKFEKIILDNTAKFEKVFNYLQTQTDKNLKAWQSKCDTSFKLQQEVNQFAHEIELLKKDISQDSLHLDETNKKIDLMIEKNQVAIAGFQDGLKSTNEKLDLANTYLKIF